MTDERRPPSDPGSIDPGEPVYDREGRLLGRVTGFTDEGFEIETVDPDDPDRVDEEIPSGKFGEGYLMWRCLECGEMGEIDEGFPESCPNCGAPREDLTEVVED